MPISTKPTITSHKSLNIIQILDWDRQKCGRVRPVNGILAPF
jgi:hypothetical protein